VNFELRIVNGNNEFKKIAKFTDLVAWQEGHKFVLMIYSVAKDFPDCEEYGLKSQLQRAGVSYTSNIAEGFAKHSSKEKNKYYKRNNFNDNGEYSFPNDSKNLFSNTYPYDIFLMKFSYRFGN